MKGAPAKALRSGTRGAVTAAKLFPAAGVALDILTSYKHGENESLPEMVCRIEKCDPTIKVVPDKPKR